MVDMSELDDLRALTNEQYQKVKKDKFALKPIYEKEKIEKRLHEVQQSFYNRLESSKLIKKHGRIPFSEHMTMTHKDKINIPVTTASLQINEDIKREVSFYNLARENVMKAMGICVQSKIPIERPDDFFAEMIKTDA